MTKHTPYPEWLTRQDIVQGEPSPWTIEDGRPTRGNAWTDIDGRRMRVPLGDDVTSRAIRAHEMVHAKVSPAAGPVIPDAHREHGVTKELATMCEEFRVNYIANEAGFDMSHLYDGSEKREGEIVAKSNNFNDVVFSIASMEGTGAIRPFMAGLRKAVKDGANPAILTHALNVRKVIKNTKRNWDKGYVSSIDSTSTHEVTVNGDYVDVPYGYVSGALGLALELRKLLRRKGDIPLDDFPGGEEIPDEGGDTGFAPLRLDKLPLTERVAGRLGRKRIACNTGRDPRRINRMLTDPERRVFDRRARGLGGVVLIDQSGSMSLSDDDLWEIIKAAPGCVIIGYSHNSYNGSDEPNCWVLADRGKVVGEVRRGNGGNGVDGPALVYALSKRRNNEPVIWVCDGYVTSANDGYSEQLGNVCADLVIKHGVHMVEDVPEAIVAFGKVAKGERLPAKLTGPMLNLRRFDRK